MPVFNINFLPVKILNYIFSFLCNTEDEGKIKKVCRLWRKIYFDMKWAVEDRRNELTLDYKRIDSYVPPVTGTVENLTLYLFGCEDKIDPNIFYRRVPQRHVFFVKYGENIRQLHVIYNRAGWPNVLSHIFEHCPNLETLTIGRRDCVLDNCRCVSMYVPPVNCRCRPIFLPPARSLHTLNIYQVCCANVVASIMNSAVVLRSLTVNHGFDVVYFTSAIERLNEIKILQCELHKDYLELILDRLGPGLTKCILPCGSLRGNCGGEKTLVHEKLNNLQNVEEIGLLGCEGDWHFLWLMNLPNLTYITIRILPHSTSITNDNVHAFALLPNLIGLQLNTTTLSRSGIESLIGSVTRPALKFLILHTGLITSTGGTIVSIAPKLPNLQIFQLSAVASESDFDAIAEHMPVLQSLTLWSAVIIDREKMNSQRCMKELVHFRLTNFEMEVPLDDVQRLDHLRTVLSYVNASKLQTFYTTYDFVQSLVDIPEAANMIIFREYPALRYIVSPTYDFRGFPVFAGYGSFNEMVHTFSTGTDPKMFDSVYNLSVRPTMWQLPRIVIPPRIIAGRMTPRIGDTMMFDDYIKTFRYIKSSESDEMIFKY